jgi:hypothetical protein
MSDFTFWDIVRNLLTGLQWRCRWWRSSGAA